MMMLNAFTSPQRMVSLLALIAMLGCLGLPLLSVMPLAQGVPPSTPYAPTPEDYSRLAEESLRVYKLGQAEKAIDLMERSIPLAPYNLEGTARNNAAALHMKEAQKISPPSLKSLEHLRQALYWMSTSWPESLNKSSTQQENLNKAQRLYTEQFKAVYKGSLTHEALAKEFQAKGTLRAAMVEYEQALKLAPKNTALHLTLADLCVLAKQYGKAVTHYRAGMQGVEPRDRELTLIKLANAQYNQGDIDQALETLNNAMAQETDPTYALRYLERFWLGIVEEDPNNVVALMNTGGVYYRKGLKSEAKAYYEKAERLLSQPNPPEVEKTVRLSLRCQYAQVMIDEGNTHGAIPLLQEVLTYEPTHTLGVTQLWRAYYLNGQGEKASPYVHAFLERPLLPLSDARYLLKVVEQSVGNNQRLAETLAPWIAAHSHQASLLQASTEALMRNRQWLEARNTAEQWQLVDSGNPNVFDALATIYQSTSQMEKSQRASEQAQALRNSPAQPKAELAEGNTFTPPGDKPIENLEMAFTALSQKQYPLAVSYGKDALANNENKALAYYYTGLAYEGLNDVLQAAQAYSNSLKENATYPEAHYALGVLELKRQNTAVARTHLQAFVELMQKQPASKQTELKPQVDFAQRALLQTEPARR